ncbi:hypothetical protein CYMTET_41484 [Cymbomonas tetramitiformis]|uniref:HAT C-terminal dimerisation domain-containing protein n=1 Tax=Cymbomonas tetramitiformis TaxID=36881 RepID=A0AAE0C626_9CHLO|nr:hypothetical protein CYMTET_41484 [Cymbomonas tetramitiformis]
MQNILKLSMEGKHIVMRQLADLYAEGISPSIGGDIWSQGGIAIFGILVYFIDKNFVFHERLVAALPFSSVHHTAEEMERATKEACAEMGIGTYRLDVAPGDGEDTVANGIHGTVSDNASNIVSGWTCFDGHECTAHTIALIVKAFLMQQVVHKVFMKLRGMTAHFNHSVIGCKLLYECQKRYGLADSKPPQDNDTRSGWGGACKQAMWYLKNQWQVVKESVYILVHSTAACDLLQGTKYATTNLVLPVIGRLAHIADDSTQLKFEGSAVTITNEHAKHARKLMYKSVTKRYFNDLMDCKLEDFAICTVFDPRYKSFKFRSAQKWMRGTFTQEKGASWARAAWEHDWKPKPTEANSEVIVTRKVTNRVSAANFLQDSDEEEPPEARTSSGESGCEQMDELARYLAYPDAAQDTDPLKWWHLHIGEFPHLSKMVRQFLSLPATSAGVERAFSVVSGMHTDLHTDASPCMRAQFSIH